MQEIMVKFTLDDKGRLRVQEQGKMDTTVLIFGICSYISTIMKVRPPGRNLGPMNLDLRNLKDEMDKLR